MRLDGRPYRIGFVGLARFAHRRYVVDVDAEFYHAASARLPIGSQFLQFDEYPPRLQRLAAQMMGDQLTHELPAFERVRDRHSRRRHVEQGLAG